MPSRNWEKILAGLLLAPIPLVARAETYLTEAQAVKLLFPGLALEPRWMDLSRDDLKRIKKAGNGDAGLTTPVRVYWGPKGEAVFIDRVLGKHEFITYAVGIAASGAIQGVEILDYRETYGGEIRNQDWRKHFIGKRASDAVALDRDIPNISGATLSSKHVTDGVRRLLQTYDILKAQR